MNIRRWLTKVLRRTARDTEGIATAASAPANGASRIYLFFDEAGDLHFGPAGTRHFLCGILAVRDPWPLTSAINDLRESLYRDRMIAESFHASEDLQATRDEMFTCIASVGGFEHLVVTIEKAKVPNEYREQGAIYTVVADMALRSAVNCYPGTQDLYVITDRLPVKSKRDSVIKGFKNCLADVAEGRRYEIAHHSCAAHPCLQAADYMNWAVFRKLERNDSRSYKIVSGLIRQELHFKPNLLGKK